MESKKLLLVGLGNPGSKYFSNRHNIGFRMVDDLMEKKNISFDHGKDCASSKFQTNSGIIYVLKPLEFMNLSGGCVQKIISKFKILSKDIMVLHDELDFPFGTIKIKFSGGHAGHNGLRNIIDTIGSKDFYRIRFGIGRPENKNYPIADYVLNNFSSEEEEKMNEYFAISYQLIQNWINDRIRDVE